MDALQVKLSAFNMSGRVVKPIFKIFHCQIGFTKSKFFTFLFAPDLHSAARLHQTGFQILNFPPDLLHHVGLVVFPNVRTMILTRKLRTAPAFKVKL